MQLEGEATARAIRLAAFVNTPLYVVHVMSIDAMEEISKARKSGFNIVLAILGKALNFVSVSVFFFPSLFLVYSKYLLHRYVIYIFFFYAELVNL